MNTINKLIICLVTLLALAGLTYASQTIYGNLNVQNNITITSTGRFIGDGALNFSCSDSQVMQKSGTRWICGNVGTGDITSVNTDGPYLYGGGTSGSISIYYNETKLNTSIDARVGSSITSTVTQAFIKALGFYTKTEVYNKTEIDNNNASVVSYINSQILTNNNSLITYINSQDVVFNNSMASYVVAQDVIANTSIKNYADNTFVAKSGDTMTGNLTAPSFKSTGNSTFNGFHIDKLNSTHYKLWGD